VHQANSFDDPNCTSFVGEGRVSARRSSSAITDRGKISIERKADKTAQTDTQSIPGLRHVLGL
jgi:hypothetical protein